MNRFDIKEHMMVHANGEGSMNGAPGVHVGTVDRVEGDSIKLTRNDSPDGQHRYVPLSWVERVDDRAVYLSHSADEVMALPTDAPQTSQGQTSQEQVPQGGLGDMSGPGGSMLSGQEIAQTGDFAGTTTDTSILSGAGAQGGMMDDHNSATGASGNVGSENGLPGQGGADTNNPQGGASLDANGVQGMQAYDNSYSGGSGAMPSAGGSAATPAETMNSNLDPALAGSDFDREAMGQAVDQHDSEDDTAPSGKSG